MVAVVMVMVMVVTMTSPWDELANNTRDDMVMMMVVVMVLGELSSIRRRHLGKPRIVNLQRCQGILNRVEKVPVTRRCGEFRYLGGRRLRGVHGGQRSCGAKKTG